MKTFTVGALTAVIGAAFAIVISIVGASHPYTVSGFEGEAASSIPVYSSLATSAILASAAVAALGAFLTVVSLIPRRQRLADVVELPAASWDSWEQAA